MQLFHGGREVIAAAPRPPAVAPSSVPSARFKTEPRALTRREIGEMVDGYRQAARFAAEGGIDGVEVCAGFDYLPTQFLSPHINRRDDEYGGSFENRLRFLREVCEAMREGIGGGVVGCRLTDERGSWDGNSEQELAQAASLLAEAGLIDYLSVAPGASSSYRGSSWIVPPVPVEHNTIAAFARRMRAAVTVPVIATGRIVDPADADAMIGRGDCDACGMTRALITDPSMPRRAREGSAFTTCIGCNQGCIGHYHAGIPIACTINPWTGHESTLPRPKQASEPGTRGGGRRRPGRRGGGRLCPRPGPPGGGVRARVRGRRPDAAGAGGARPCRDRERAGGHAGLVAGRAASFGSARRRRPRRCWRSRRERVVVAAGAGRHDEGVAGAVHAWDVLAGAGHRRAGHRRTTGAATGPGWRWPSC